MNPILKYRGAKWRLADWIISHMPPHESYLEPFFGSGGVFFNKPKSHIETINDIDGEVVNFFRVCRTRPDELAGLLQLTPWSREERNNAFDHPGDDELERARTFATRHWMTFGAAINKSNGFRITKNKTNGGGSMNPKLWARLPDIVAEASKRLLEAQIECMPALKLISRFNGPEVLIYADPPYMRSLRTASGAAYRTELSDSDHEELLAAITNHKGMVLLSGYDSDLYNDMLQGWQKEMTNTTAETGAKRTECLWINPAAIERNSKQYEMRNILNREE